MKDFYTCPQHNGAGGYESCCDCGGWDDDEEERHCSECVCEECEE